MLKMPIKIILSFSLLLFRNKQFHFIMISQNQIGMTFTLQNLLGTDAYPSKPAGYTPSVTERSSQNSKLQRARHCTHQTKYYVIGP